MPELLDESQRLVVDLPPDAEGVVIGEPGSGKTHTLIARTVQLLRDGAYAPDELVVLTPSRRTATRLRDAIALEAGVATPGAPARSLGSLAFQIVRAAEVRAGRPAPQLLTGADQDRIVAELLAGDAQDAHLGDARWPDDMPADVRDSRAFRSELRALVAQCTELELSPDELAAIGAQREIPMWVSAAGFLTQYRGVMAALAAAHRDAADLLAEAATLLRDAARGEQGERELGPIAKLKAVLIDDAQELTLGALALVAALRSRGVAVLAFGDPDIGSGQFRGATPELFAELAAMLQNVHVLRTQHRQSEAIARITRSATQAIGAAGRVDHRRAPGEPVADERVRTILAASSYEEVDEIAYALRSWHLGPDAVPYARMAVLAHDTRQVAALEEELAARDIPTRAAGVQRPLGRERVVRDLLEIVQLAAVPALEREPEALASALLSPFGGLDAVGLRRLRGALRHAELASGGMTSASELLRAAMADPKNIGAFDTTEARVAERFATTLSRLAEAHERGETIHELLWVVWDRARVDGVPLADAWREIATGTGPMAADTSRALDALVALFEAAKRAVERDSGAEPLTFVHTILDSDVPEDTLAGAIGADTVTLLTPATALGTEFDAVVIAGVQDGVWPNVRLRGGMLEAWQLPDAVAAFRGGNVGTPASMIDRRRAVLHDELRLFVRAVSRATSHVLLTAVDDDDSTPSVLLGFFPEPERSAAQSAHPLTLRGAVAKYRRALTDEQTSEAERAEAATQLRVLADAHVPGAAPEQWFGITDVSSTAPLRDPARTPISVSPSTIERFEKCGIDWAVRALGGDTASWSGGLGTILHAAMEEIPDGAAAALQEVVDSRWDELQFESPWLSAKEHAWAEQLVSRLSANLAKFQREGGVLAGAEATFELYVPLIDEVTEADIVVRTAPDVDPPLAADTTYAVLRGSIDRVEVYEAGRGENIPVDPADEHAPRVMVADLKTGRSPKKYTDGHVADDAQLSAYQLAVRAGAIADADPQNLAGARLILLSQLGKGKQYRYAQQPPMDAETAAGFLARIVSDARQMAEPHFHGDIELHCSNDLFAICSIHTVKAVSAS